MPQHGCDIFGDFMGRGRSRGGADATGEGLRLLSDPLMAERRYSRRLADNLLLARFEVGHRLLRLVVRLVGCSAGAPAAAGTVRRRARRHPWLIAPAPISP